MMLDMKRTFDEIVVRALDAGAGRADPGEPLLPVAVLVLRRHAGVHGDGEARPAAGPRRVGPDHRRHPAVPVGAGLPGRARSGWAASSTAGFIRLLIAPAQAGGRAYLKVVSAGVLDLHRVHHQDPRAPSCCATSPRFVAALDTMFGGFRERAEQTYELLKAPGTAFVVVAAPEPDALREASYFVERLAASACRWPGWCSTGSAPRRRPGCRPSARRRRRGARRDRHARAGRRGAAGARRAAAAGRPRPPDADRFTSAHPEVPSSRCPRWRRTCTTWTASVRSPGRSRPRTETAPERPCWHPPRPRGTLPRTERRGRPSPPGAGRPRRWSQPASCSCKCSRRADSSRVRQDSTSAPALEQRTTLPLRHAAPHPELDAVVQRIGQALGPHGATHAHSLGSVLRRPLHEELVRVARPAACALRPVHSPLSDHSLVP